MSGQTTTKREELVVSVDTKEIKDLISQLSEKENLIKQYKNDAEGFQQIRGQLATALQNQGIEVVPSSIQKDNIGLYIEKLRERTKRTERELQEIERNEREFDGISSSSDQTGRGSAGRSSLDGQTGKQHGNPKEFENHEQLINYVQDKAEDEQNPEFQKIRNDLLIKSIKGASEQKQSMVFEDETGLGRLKALWKRREKPDIPLRK